ncbi:FxsA family protein [Haloglomus salinum]|uniref:FxsA family protein n=1 Tax=Haloglomus salinum TaxID=2962673 RepID=UPI0020C97FC6|nr:FxsA family protein [Haloglomus salinum]
MFGLLLLFALLLSLADALLLVVVAGEIGALPTVGLVVLTALLGSLLVRSEGRATLRRLQQRAQQMEAPTDELLDGALILAGGAFLITPGLLTDLTGFLFVIPLTRYPLRVALKRWIVGPYIREKMENGSINVQFGSIGGGGGFGGAGSTGGAGGAGGPGWPEPDDGPGGRSSSGDADDGDDVYDLGDDAYDIDVGERDEDDPDRSQRGDH